MAYEDSRPRPETEHRLVLEGREQLTVTGVEEVESFDESSIVMVTDKGALDRPGGAAAHRAAVSGRGRAEGGGLCGLPHL